MPGYTFQVQHLVMIILRFLKLDIKMFFPKHFTRTPSLEVTQEDIISCTYFGACYDFNDIRQSINCQIVLEEEEKEGKGKNSRKIIDIILRFHESVGLVLKPDASVVTLRSDWPSSATKFGKIMFYIIAIIVCTYLDREYFSQEHSTLWVGNFTWFICET